MSGRQIAVDFGIPLTAATVVTGLLIWWVYAERAELSARNTIEVRTAERLCLDADGVRIYNAKGQYAGCDFP